jgi:Tol biopolymer transport system component
MGGGRPQRLADGLLGASAAWAPDGDALAVTATVRGQSRPTLLLIDAASGKRRSLTDVGVGSGAPAWTPDGRWITYSGEDGSVEKIHRDGSGRRRLFRLAGEEIAGLSWSPDGRHLALTARPIPASD